jgi:hypothetical protein
LLESGSTNLWPWLDFGFRTQCSRMREGHLLSQSLPLLDYCQDPLLPLVNTEHPIQAIANLVDQIGGSWRFKNCMRAPRPDSAGNN